jgi:ribosomal-protein-alanine N-acetyltransferase
MLFIAESERLLYRELLPEDEQKMFELDSDPEVHRFLGNQPVTSIVQCRQTIAAVRHQYVTYGIGRWATIEKSSGEFIGWSGLKHVTELVNNHVDYIDVGYRLIPKYWGKGYATESAKKAIEYGFDVMKLKEIYAGADCKNVASRRVLEKSGMQYIETFDYKGRATDWFKIEKK